MKVDMKKIKLSQGKIALVSDVDYVYLNQWKWHYCNGYAFRNINYKNRRKTLRMHRVILERMGFTNFKDTDHVNGNGIDNRRSKLRPATRLQNQWNKAVSIHNTSGYKGVYWYRITNKWKAQIGVQGKRKHLGYFKTRVKAAEAYNKAAKKYFGKFARLNQI